MKTLIFTTNLTDSESVAAVTPHLNAIEPIDGWNVSTDDPNKLLAVQTVDNRIAEQVIQAVGKAGYAADLVTT